MVSLTKSWIMKQLLVPTDLSEQALNSIDYLIPIAINLDAAVHFVHAVDDLFVAHDRETQNDTGVEKYTNDILHKMQTEAAQKMELLAITFKNKLQESGKHLPVFTYIENGVADSVILKKAAELHPQLIIMGRHKHYRITRLFFGSIAQTVMQKSNCPVFVVPDAYSFVPPKEILYISALTENDIYAIGKLLNLMQPFALKLHIVYFNSTAGKPMPFLHQLANQVQQDHQNIKVDFEVVDSKLLHAAWQQYIQHHQIDLIAVINEKQHGFDKLLHPTTSVDVLYQSVLPVMILHQ